MSAHLLKPSRTAEEWLDDLREPCPQVATLFSQLMERPMLQSVAADVAQAYGAITASLEKSRIVAMSFCEPRS